MDKFYKKTDAFFQTDNQDLQFILAKVRKLGEINKKVLAVIDPSISRFCQVANISGNKMIVLVKNSSAATQLRFLVPDVLKKLQQDAGLRHIKDIQIKMGVPDGRVEMGGSGVKKQVMSKETGEIVKGIADSLEDPKLREIMQRIAELGKG
jgi:hypothetical protein